MADNETEKPKEKHAGGRPRRYPTLELMQKAVDAYFETCIVAKVPTTVCGLALALGFAQRKSLFDYKGYGEEFCNIIKKAITTIEANYESMLSRSTQVAGPIFALKNMGWRDQKDVNVGGSVTLILKDDEDCKDEDN